MSSVWGLTEDSDTLEGIEQYERMGLTLLTPTDVARLGDDELRKAALECSSLLDSTYKGNYPQSTKDVDALASSMARGDTLMFMLMLGMRVIAIASLVRRTNGMRGGLSFIELSKAAKLQDADVTDVPVRCLSKFRLLWAVHNLPEVHFLYGSPRAAKEGKNGAPGGRQAQSVWWGGRRNGASLPLLATNVGWNFRVGDIEPLTGFTSPMQPIGWAKAVGHVPLFLPDEEVADCIRTVFDEGTNGIVTPAIVVDADKTGEEFAFRESRLPMSDIVTKYYVTEIADHLPERSSVDINAQLADDISQKVVIETDVASTPRGARIMRSLIASGWAFVGWQPSEVVYGGVCPMLARVNPQLVHELIEPVHHARYFDEGGLAGTKRVLDGMYAEMLTRASSI